MGTCLGILRHVQPWQYERASTTWDNTWLVRDGSKWCPWGTLDRLFLASCFALHDPSRVSQNHFSEINFLQTLIQGLLFLGRSRWRQGFVMIACFSSTNFLKVNWDLEFEQVALVLPMVWSPKSELVMSVSRLSVIILTTSAKRKEEVGMGKGRDMQQSL